MEYDSRLPDTVLIAGEFLLGGIFQPFPFPFPFLPSALQFHPVLTFNLKGDTRAVSQVDVRKFHRLAHWRAALKHEVRL